MMTPVLRARSRGSLSFRRSFATIRSDTSSSGRPPRSAASRRRSRRGLAAHVLDDAFDARGFVAGMTRAKRSRIHGRRIGSPERQEQQRGDKQRGGADVTLKANRETEPNVRRSSSALIRRRRLTRILADRFGLLTRYARPKVRAPRRERESRGHERGREEAETRLARRGERLQRGARAQRGVEEPRRSPTIARDRRYWRRRVSSA